MGTRNFREICLSDSRFAYKKFAYVRKEIPVWAKVGVGADAEPRRDGVTAAFRSKTRRLLPLPRPCRPRAPHSWARRPSWSLILTWRMDLSQRRSTSPLSTCILMLNRRVRCRNVAGRMPSHHSWSRHPCSAAHTAQQPRREPRAIPTAYGHGYRGGHLGSLQQPYERRYRSVPATYCLF